MFLKRRSVLETELLEGVASGGTLVKKTPSQVRQEKIEKRAAKLKKEADEERQEHLEYLKFPTIMGWYFDGTFTKDFTLFEEYAEYFNEIEEELETQKDLIIEETITEKAFRNFWPPDYVCGGKYFRTRGIYLDFKEVREDPPKTPPNINYEKQRGVIGVQLDEGAETVNEEGKEVKLTKPLYGLPGFRDARDNWFWHELRREYRPKEQDDEYIWSPDEKIWVEGDPTFRTPYDWYFDEFLGKFRIRDRSKPELYVFDHEKNVWLKKDVKGPSLNGLRRNDYFYDERLRKWLPMTNPTGNIVFYQAGLREVVIGDRGKSGLTPDDFYYDGETGKMHEKDPNASHNDYYYDTRDQMWKKKGQPYGPGKANHYPTDYEFDIKEGVYFPKHAKECKHIEPLDWYFDRKEGKFFMKDGNKRDHYEYDWDLHVFYLKGFEGPAVNELTPTDYYWNENDRQWKLVVTVKDPMTMLDYHDAARRRIMRGERGRSGKTPDDFYYDAIDGSFFRKDPRILNSYWFDPDDMCWKKRGQYYGPGYFRLYPEHYYFDYDDGFFFPTTTAKFLLARLRRGELKGVSDNTPYDYCFNEVEGIFQMRNREFVNATAYNKETGVFHFEAPKSMKLENRKTPKDYFYDEVTGSWLPIEHPRGHEARYYKAAKRNNRMGPRGKTGKIPDDYYFDFAEGEFRLRPPDQEDKFEYLPDVGVWREIGAQAHPAEGQKGSKPKPTDFYFDKEEGQFIPKTKLQYGEIYLNPFTNLWYQKWRSPKDFYWDSRQLRYLRKPTAPPKKAEMPRGLGIAGGGRPEDTLTPEEREAIEEAEREHRAWEKRNYERPWLHNYLVLAADEMRFEQELAKARLKAERPEKAPETKEAAATAKGVKKQTSSTAINKTKLAPPSTSSLRNMTSSTSVNTTASSAKPQQLQLQRRASLVLGRRMSRAAIEDVPPPDKPLPNTYMLNKLIMGPEPAGRPSKDPPPETLIRFKQKSKEVANALALLPKSTDEGAIYGDESEVMAEDKKSKKKKRKDQKVISAGGSLAIVAENESGKKKKRKSKKKKKDEDEASAAESAATVEDEGKKSKQKQKKDKKK